MESGVKQDHTHYVGGSFASYTVGNHNQVSSKATTFHSETSVTMSSKGKDKDQAPVRISLGKQDGTVFITGAKHVNIVGAEDFAVNSKTISLTASDKFSISAGGNMDVKAGGTLKQEAGGEHHLKGSKVIAGPSLWASDFHSDVLFSQGAGGGGESPGGAGPAKTNHASEEKGEVATNTSGQQGQA